MADQRAVERSLEHTECSDDLVGAGQHIPYDLAFERDDDACS
jgi:hypothetical protein